jgi:hypothetical protein
VAQKITVEMTDDLDGSAANTTVRFAVDGTAYEIDLSKERSEDTPGLRPVYRARPPGHWWPSLRPATS